MRRSLRYAEVVRAALFLVPAERRHGHLVVRAGDLEGRAPGIVDLRGGVDLLVGNELGDGGTLVATSGGAPAHHGVAKLPRAVQSPVLLALLELGADPPRDR